MLSSRSAAFLGTLLWTTAVLVSFSTIEARDLPSYIKTCRRSDPNVVECAKERSKEAIPSLLKGDKDYGVPKLNPLNLPLIELNPGPSLSIKVTDVVITGLETAKLVDAKVTNKTLIFSIGFDGLEITGTYDVKGKILTLPIQGNGPMKINTKNSVFDVSYDWKFVEKNGQNYLDIPDADIKMSHDDFRIRLDNLFNGDKSLGDRTNELINENWRELSNEVAPSIIQVIKKVVLQIINGIASDIPFDVVFPY